MAPVDFAKLTLQDVLDLAILIEEEARERYEEFSEMVGGRYEGDAADVFRAMAANEARHGEELRVRRVQLFEAAPSRVDRSMVFDVEAPDPGKPRPYMSPRQALEVALESELKAHDFFAEALGHVNDPDVRALLEELRDEESQHAAHLKAQMLGHPPGPDIEDDEAEEPPAL